MAKRVRVCPVCGKEALITCSGTYHFKFPGKNSERDLSIRGVNWEHCENCEEDILSPEIENQIEKHRQREQELLYPEEITIIRKRMGLSQAEMAKLLGVGEKTYTRWEIGTSFQTKSMDNLIRIAEQNPEILIELEAQREPKRVTLISEYFKQLFIVKSQQKYSFATHGEPEILKRYNEQISTFLGKIRKKEIVCKDVCH